MADKASNMTKTLERPLTRDDYVAVSVSMLIPEKLSGISLYINDPYDSQMRLLRGPEYPITQKDLDLLQSTGRTKVFLPSSQHRQFQSYLRENLNTTLADESLSPA